MNTELETLIKMATADGTITDAERALIYAKGDSLGVSRDEVDIYLKGSLALVNAPAQHVKSQKRSWGKWLIACAIFDFVLMIYFANQRHGEQAAMLSLITGIFFLLLGIHLVWRRTWITAGVLIVPISAIALAMFISSQFFNWNDTVAWISFAFSLVLFGTLYFRLFRKKLQMAS